MKTATRVGIALVICITAIVLLWAFAPQLRQQPDIRKNPFEYDISAFIDTHKHPARYRETAPITLADTAPHGIASDSHARIYVCSDSAVTIISTNGTRLARFALTQPAGCMAASETGSLFLGMRDHVEVYNTAGMRTATWTSLGENARLTSIAVMSNDVFVADGGNRAVWRFDTDGRMLGRIGNEHEPPDRPGFVVPGACFDVVPGHDGSVWIVDPGRQQLKNFSANGEYRSSWGEASMEIHGFCGCCNPTHVAITPDGSFVTSEKGITRVKMFDGNGVFRGVVAGPGAFAPGTLDLDLAVDAGGRILVLDPHARTIRIFTPVFGGKQMETRSGDNDDRKPGPT